MTLKKLVERADGDAVTVVVTYKDKQLAWIKKHGVYNYPVRDEDGRAGCPQPAVGKVGNLLVSCAKVKELWLYASDKGKRYCFAADFVGIQSKDEFLAANPTYVKLGPNKHSKYMVFKTTFLDYGPRLEGATVFARVSDFEKGRGRTKKIAAAIKRFHDDGDFGLLADYLPRDLAKLPREQLRVCEAAVQFSAWSPVVGMSPIQEKIASIVMSVAAFGRERGMSASDAYCYLNRYSGMAFLDEHYSASRCFSEAKITLQSYLRSGLGVVEAVDKANHRLATDNDANMFVTAWIGVVDLATGEVEYVNAGHNPPLLKRADGSVEYLTARSGPPLAVMDGISYRRQAHDAGALIDGVLKDVYAFADGAEQVDDITLLGFKLVCPQNVK